MSRKVLVVEDEPGIADTLVYALRTEGFVPVWCSTAGAAREALAAGDVALVVLDIGLPDVNGLDFCRELRQSSEVPVIFLTARASELDRVVGLEIGGDDYVVKPFSPREVTSRVRAVLRRVAAPAPGAAQAAPLVLDRERVTARYFGVPLDLTRCEYRLLETLAARPGRVYTREQLLSAAWPEPEACTDRTVDTHVKTLRAKLYKVRSDVDLIQTHRGIGYSLKEHQ